MIRERKLKAPPIKVLPDGFAGVAAGLDMMRQNKVSAEKLVIRVKDTPGCC